MSTLSQPGLDALAGQDRAFDVWEIRRDFPILAQKIHGKPLVYLDNAATTQKPRPVLDAMTRYYLELNSNVHRGVHLLSQKATDAYEQVRTKVQQFLHAREEREIVFVRGATEGINLVARTFGRSRVRAGDEILISTLEHHSNIVPWQILCEEAGAHLRVIPMKDSGELLLEEYEKLLTPKTRLVSLVHVSNALGTINPVKEMIRQAHARQIPVLVDGAQAVSHIKVDVQELDCDFYVFSAHKIYGPTGIGVLYGKAELLEAMPPFLGGGDMIRSVSFSHTTYNEIPYKFEAGTPAIAEVIGMGAALDYVNGIGMDTIDRYERDLLAYATQAVQAVHQLRLIGTAPHKAGVLSFLLEGIHPHDIGTILDRQGIAIRAGHHCAQPLMDRLGIPATARASLAFYNTREEIDALVTGIRKVREIFG
jgi:cysteine desulfurase/selenocysteine lyase